MPKHELIEITPLGAAIVEAMPDRVKVKKVKADFRRGKCPASEIFSKAAVAAYYRKRGQKITAIAKEETTDASER